MTEEEEDRINQKAAELISSGRVVEDYIGLSDDEALTVILPTVGFDEVEAQFILDRARGRLVEEYTDVDGNEHLLIY